MQAQQANENEREMIVAAERGELVLVKKLLAAGARIDARDQRGRSALLAATQRNRIDTARFLIQEGADVNAKDFIQDTPYLYAAAEGRIESARREDLLPRDRGVAGPELAQQAHLSAVEEPDHPVHSRGELWRAQRPALFEIGRASCRERV